MQAFFCRRLRDSEAACVGAQEARQRVGEGEGELDGRGEAVVRAESAQEGHASPSAHLMRRWAGMPFFDSGPW